MSSRTDDDEDDNDDSTTARARQREEQFMAKQFENPEMLQVKEILTNPAKYKEVQRKLAINEMNISSSSEDDDRPPLKRVKSMSKPKPMKKSDPEIAIPVAKGRSKSILQESMEVKKSFLDLKREKFNVQLAKIEAEARRSDNEFRLKEKALANELQT